MQRQGLADSYKMACARLLESQWQACSFEIPLFDGFGNLRADVMAIDRSLSFTIIEVKSCKADFTTDKKWPSYLGHCHRFYFCSDPKTLEKISSEILKTEYAEHVGLIAVDPETLEAKIIKPSKARFDTQIPSEGRLLRLMIWNNRPTRYQTDN